MKDKIPGIGRYSAGAICSIAYNQTVPVVITLVSLQLLSIPNLLALNFVRQLDGNVHRLLSRFLALHAPPKAKATLEVLWSAATALVEGTDHPGDLNQSLIELGSVLCKVRDPACSACPIRSWCKAFQNSEAKVIGTTSVLVHLLTPLPMNRISKKYHLKRSKSLTLRRYAPSVTPCQMECLSPHSQ